MAFPSQFLDEIRARISISEIVGRRVKLTRKGRVLWGLCPFHNEKSPSFKVEDERGRYHCFGCHADGDAIRFLTDAEGMTFPEAVEHLAGLANLPMPRQTPQAKREMDERERLFAVNEAACKWFAARLEGPEGGRAREYLSGRGLSAGTIASFRLGFAPEGRDKLSEALSGHGPEYLKALGLVKKPEDGRPSFDFFRGRVIFPIADRQGRVIAFGGRLLGPGEPKYLNTPETILFHKGETLFGLAAARAATRATREVIVVEGYMDVIALHQAGIRQTVAPLGTALTEGQLAALWRLAPLATLCFDGDSAGLRAARRAAERALPLVTPDRVIRFVALPAGEDPDSLVRQSGADGFRTVTESAKSLTHMLWDMHVGAGLPETEERRAALKRDLRKQLDGIEDRDVAREYRRSLEQRFMAAFADTLFGEPKVSAKTRPTGGDAGQIYAHGFHDGAKYREFSDLAPNFDGGYRAGFGDGNDNNRRLLQHLDTLRGRANPAELRAFRSGYEQGHGDAVARRGYRLQLRQRERASGLRNLAKGPKQLPKPSAILLAAALNHPWKAAAELDEFGALEMPRESHRVLHQAIVQLLTDSPELDSEELRRHLTNLGLDNCVEAAVPRSLFLHAGFALPDTPPETVEAGWREMFMALARERAKGELEAELNALPVNELPGDGGAGTLTALERLGRISGDLEIPAVDDG